MRDIILYLLLSVIAVCLIIIACYFVRLSKKSYADTPVIEEEPEIKLEPTASKPTHSDPLQIPDDVAFNNKNLPYRKSRSTKRKVNYGKDFNAYLVKGGTLYHKNSCKKLDGKKIVVKHIYECIADHNKRPCPHCKPRTQVHEWYADKFPDSVFAKADKHSNAPAIEVNSYPEFENGHQFSILDYEQQRD